jgi:hypothetical protein
VCKPRPALFKWRHFEPVIIVCTVRWYLRYSLSYRDVEELVSERGLAVDHTTIWRWVQRYAPELNRRCRRELKPTNRSWRVDENLYSGGPVELPLSRLGFHLGQRSTSGFRRNAMRLRRSLFPARSKSSWTWSAASSECGRQPLVPEGDYRVEARAASGSPLAAVGLVRI